MARAWFGGGVGDQVFGEIVLGRRAVYGPLIDVNGDAAATTLDAYSAPDISSTHYTDLLAADGTTAITYVTTSVGFGYVPRFKGPNGVTELWLTADGIYFFRFAVGPQGPAGAGNVDSVNGLDGPDITLTQDNIPTGTTYKRFSAIQETRLSNASMVGVSAVKYGADTSGVALSDDALEDAALAAVNGASGGAGIFLDPGVYKVSKNFVIPSGASLFCSGVGNTIIRAAAGASMDALITTETDQLNWLMTIADLQLDGNRDNGANVDHGIRWFGGSDSAIQRCRIVNIDGNGIWLTGDSIPLLGTAVKVQDVNIRSCSAVGIVNDATATDTMISGCDVGMCDSHAIYLDGSNSSVIDSIGWGSLTGLYVAGQLIRVNGGRFDNNGLSGLVLAGDEILVSGTLVHDNSSASDAVHPGIEVGSGAGKVMLTGVRSRGGAVPGQTQQSYGLRLVAGRTGPTIVTDCDFTDNDAGAIDYQGHVAGDRISQTAGYNPQPVQTPTMALTTVPFTNPFPYDCTVYLSGAGVSNVFIDGSFVSSWYSLGGLRVPVGSTLRVDYTGTVTWAWFSS